MTSKYVISLGNDRSVRDTGRHESWCGTTAVECAQSSHGVAHRDSCGGGVVWSVMVWHNGSRVCMGVVVLGCGVGVVVHGCGGAWVWVWHNGIGVCA